MKFDINNSKLIYEVRDLGDNNEKERWMHEQIYRTNEGTYFLCFEGGPKSRYRIRVSENMYEGSTGSCELNEEEVEIWKGMTQMFQENRPETYLAIDWEKEEDESVMEEENELWKDDLFFLGELGEDELPF